MAYKTKSIGLNYEDVCRLLDILGLEDCPICRLIIDIDVELNARVYVEQHVPTETINVLVDVLLKGKPYENEIEDEEAILRKAGIIREKRSREAKAAWGEILDSKNSKQ